MILFAGLGNPGQSYQNHRHNVGFMALDAIAGRYGFGPFKSKFQGQVSEGKIGGKKVLLLKPETFMNHSGQAVREAMDFYKLSPAEVFVFYDEIDLAPGKMKVKTGGGAAGHNGIRSLIAHLGEDFHRVRIGVGHPGHKDLVHGFVLSNFSKADGDWRDPLLDAIAGAASRLVKGEIPRFQTDVALVLDPGKESEGD